MDWGSSTIYMTSGAVAKILPHSSNYLDSIFALGTVWMEFAHCNGNMAGGPGGQPRETHPRPATSYQRLTSLKQMDREIPAWLDTITSILNSRYPQIRSIQLHCQLVLRCSLFHSKKDLQFLVFHVNMKHWLSEVQKQWKQWRLWTHLIQCNGLHGNLANAHK